MTEGLYEEIITKLVKQKLEQIDESKFFINTSKIDKEEASLYLSKHIFRIVKNALSNIRGDNQIERQLEIANKIVLFLRDELEKEEISGELLLNSGEILKAVFAKVNSGFSDINTRLSEITPYTRLIHSELFTGGNAGVSLQSELKKEILSSNNIDLLVSFIKFRGVIILKDELEEFTRRGGKLRVITTTYMGASDYKAIQMLSKLDNTEVKISYNTAKERLHAKAYLFKRNTGYHTGYIGSSNFSRSALTDGLEWNLKITSKEVSHIIDKFQKTFDSYWQSDDFEIFNDGLHWEKLTKALAQSGTSALTDTVGTYFNLKPEPFQNEILEKLEVERTVHNRFRNLIVAATGTGKTVVSAFDYHNFKKSNRSARLLFIAHRKEILVQAMLTYRNEIRDNNFGELWVEGQLPNSFEFVFASVMSVNNKIDELNLTPEYYDYIVVDECHHLTASSYRGIINHFKPKILLGLTATPERMDGGDIQEDFNNRIAAEIRLPEALNRRLLCPFQYFGVSDRVDLRTVDWEKGKYAKGQLSALYIKDIARIRDIIDALDKYTKDKNDVRALGFCVTIEHAQFMAEKFKSVGLNAEFLTSSNSVQRDDYRRMLQKKEINYLFVVDIFNEGVDIPEIDTVLFLRPTESLTIFLQQLGRGLRLAEGKECLTVLDFVGNSRPEYNFENKFRALVGKTVTSIVKEVEDNFPHLPLGCSILLEKKAKQVILENIKAATGLRKDQVVRKIQNFEHNSSLPLNLKNFLEFYSLPLQAVYNHGSWKRLCSRAGRFASFDETNEKEVTKAINKWLSTSSVSYFTFILNLARNKFNISVSDYKEEEVKMLTMLYYDMGRSPGDFKSLQESITQLSKNEVLIDEIIEVLALLVDRIDFKEIAISLPYHQPLKVHSRYTRDQILAAMGKSTFEKKYPSREGVVEIAELNTELLFINLIKSEENFSPTTMYDDYAINEFLFHWQSQNSAAPETPKGISYINHEANNKRILLFVREKQKDEFSNRMGYVFIGEGKLRDYYGERPMNIKWELSEPIPHFLWNDALKMRVG